MWRIFQAVVSAIIVLGVSEISRRTPRLGALFLSLPLVSALAFVFIWLRDHDQATISRLAFETVVLVVLGLPFFVPLVFAQRWGLGFWTALALGVAAAAVTSGAYFILAPKS